MVVLDGSWFSVAYCSNAAWTSVPMWRAVSPTQLNSGGARDWLAIGRCGSSGAGVRSGRDQDEVRRRRGCWRTCGAASASAGASALRLPFVTAAPRATVVWPPTPVSPMDGMANSLAAAVFFLVLV